MISGEGAIALFTRPVGATVVPLVPASYEGPKPVRAVCSVETAAVRLRYDGENPDSGTGHKLAADVQFVLEGVKNIERAKLIRATSTDAVVQVTIEVL